jgi:geranylgeranyl diphosphate synthase type I
VAMALEAASEAQADVVARHLGDPALDLEGVSALREVIVDTGAVDRVEALIAELTSDALEALDAAPFEDAAREVLRELAAAATARTV